jgi:uncharacterized RDD family membrane protein YckC
MILLYALCLFILTSLTFLALFKEIPYIEASRAHWISFITLVLPVFLYFFISEKGKFHASVGKRMNKISVVSTTDSYLSSWQVFLRNTIKLLPWELGHLGIFLGVKANWQFGFYSLPMLLFTLAYLLPLIYIIFMVVDKKHRCLHDLLTNTRVIISQERTNSSKDEIKK